MHEALAKDARCRGYFSVLRSLLQFMLGPNQPTKLFLRHVVPDFPLVYCHQGLRRFEGLDARTRGILLGAAVGLLQNWPYRFIELLRELGIRKNWITHDYDLPPWYLNAFKIAAGSSAISEPALGEGVLIAARKEGWIAAINSSDHYLPESRVA
jgi:hypothetical protein